MSQGWTITQLVDAILLTSKTFTQDFHLEVYFDRNRNLGYITFPLLPSNHVMDMVPGVRQVGFDACSYIETTLKAAPQYSQRPKTLDPSVTTPPTTEQKAIFRNAMTTLKLMPISLRDDCLGAAFLDLPSLTTKEQGSRKCNRVGCHAGFDTALDLHIHQILGHSKFPTNFQEFSNNTNGN